MKKSVFIGTFSAGGNMTEVEFSASTSYIQRVVGMECDPQWLESTGVQTCKNFVADGQTCQETIYVDELSCFVFMFS